MRHLVIGAGEVGRAIFETLERGHLSVYLADKEASSKHGEYEVLHICFPYAPDVDFVAQVQTYAERLRSDLVIVHSTVPVGTTYKIGPGTVHSPVSGRHPHLKSDLKIFTKWFGGTRAEEASEIFTECGLHCATVPSPETTELGKLLQTLQYGWQILLQKEAHVLAEHYHADYSIAYQLFNADYNHGNEILNRPFRFPILQNIPGPIGGHCVIPNAQILAQEGSNLAQLLLGLDEALSNG